MNFWIFLKFLDFILIFKEFEGFNSLLKIEKSVYLSRGTRGADVA